MRRVGLAWGVAVALAAPGAGAEETCRRFGEPRDTGSLASEAIVESSGLAASPRQAGVFFTHNDSGDVPRIFAMDASGRDLGVFTVAGAAHRDWEDLAVGPCGAAPCLFVGDVGDNGRERARVTVYRVPEPQVGSGPETAPAVQLDLQYPDGARDVEALLVDPKTGDLFLVEKVQAAEARVAVLRDAGGRAGGSYRLEALGAVEATALLTGGDFEPLGTQVILRDYGGEALRYAARRDDAGRVTGFVRLDQPKVGLLGEAIAYRADGLALLSTREGAGAPLSETPCLDPDGQVPGAAVGPLAGVSPAAPTKSGGCRGGGAALAPLLLLLGWRRRRGLGLGLGVLLSSSAAAAAPVEHQVYGALAAEAWPTPAGGHGVALLGWRALHLAGDGTFELTFNTDTLSATYRDLCAGALCFGAELRGEALVAGLLSDYYARGERVPARGFKASYLAGAAHAELRLAPAFLRYQVTGRRWFFGGAGDGFTLPAEATVLEQELAATYWAFAPDPSLHEPHRLSPRVEGLGLGVRAGLDLRSDHRPWGADGENDPAQVILRVRQWARYGARLTSRLRGQVEERFAWGRGEDDLTRDRVGGLNPYVTPLGGVPWAAFVLGRYVAGRASLHARVWEDVEVGAFVDAVAAQGLERDGGPRFGGALGAGGFADVRWGAWQADLWLGWAPGLSWSAHAHQASGWLAVGYRLL